MESAPLEILYRDEWMVAVNKPSGQLVHPAEVPAEDDEVTMKLLRDQIGQRVHVIHRLDRPTSGVLLFATDRDVARSLHQSFEKHEIDKIYLAVVSGYPKQESWNCSEPIRKEEESAERAAETEFLVLENLEHSLSLIEARPKTGRFHQIRRHLLHAGHPIVGDYRYAGVECSDELGKKLGTWNRMLLQAKSLRFDHPVTEGKTLIEAITDPMIQRARGLM